MNKQLLWRSASILPSNQLIVIGVLTLYFAEKVYQNPSLLIFAAISGVCFWILGSRRFTKVGKRRVVWALGLITLPLLLIHWSEPSHALLLSRVQGFMLNNFAGAGAADADYTELINTVINMMRFAFMAFVVYAGWQGWQDYRQQEEMSAITRVAVGALGVVFLVDALSAVVVPDTGTGAP